jgi:hypothetical protein
MTEIANSTKTKHIIVLRRDLAKCAFIMLAIGFLFGVLFTGGFKAPDVRVSLATGEDVQAKKKTEAMIATMLAIFSESANDVQRLKRAECVLQNELLLARNQKINERC